MTYRVLREPLYVLSSTAITQEVLVHICFLILFTFCCLNLGHHPIGFSPHYVPRADKEYKCSWLGTFQLDDIKPCSDIRSVEMGQQEATGEVRWEEAA